MNETDRSAWLYAAAPLVLALMLLVIIAILFR